MIYLFILFYLFAIYAEALTPYRKKQFLILTCVVLALGAGMRNQVVWPDTRVYTMGFQDYTPTLGSLSSIDTPFGYSEMGFFYIGVVVKTFTSNATAYLVVVSAITFFFLYLSFRKYAFYPFLGICAYLARFFTGRNLIQIRSGLAYAIILFGIQFITKRDWKRYFAERREG